MEHDKYLVVLRASRLKAISAEAQGRATKTATTCENIVFPQKSNLQPFDYWSTALPHELEKTSPHILNFGYLNAATCLLHNFTNKSKMFFDVWWPEF